MRMKGAEAVEDFTVCPGFGGALAISHAPKSTAPNGVAVLASGCFLIGIGEDDHRRERPKNEHNEHGDDEA